MRKIIFVLLLCMSVLAGCSESDSSTGSEYKDSSVIDSVSDEDSSDDVDTTTTTTTTTGNDVNVAGTMMSLDYFLELVSHDAYLSFDDYEQYQNTAIEVNGLPGLELNLFDNSAKDRTFTLYVYQDVDTIKYRLVDNQGNSIDPYRDDIEAFLKDESVTQSSVTTSAVTDSSDDVQSSVTPVTTTPVTTTTPTVTTKPATTTTTAIVTEKASGVKYANCVANMRSGNNTSYPVVTQVAKNTKVTIKGKCSNGWYAVEVNGKTGYMSSSVLSDAPITTTPTTPTTTTPTTTPPTTNGSSGGNTSLPYDAHTVEFMNEVLRLTNEFRAENGVAPLTLDVNLTAVSMLRANELTEVFSHTRPDGSSCYTAFDAAGFSLGTKYFARGENIAAGQATPEEVVEAWKNSTQGHREAMLNSKYTKLGVGYVYDSSDPYKHYWVQSFIG
ncbi:MAG: SH3 domain-containing protein [Oscillospiraceae bacterium]|nr:SH3 domain-containing protein [Oscillospiraceae bacterium]